MVAKEAPVWSDADLQDMAEYTYSNLYNRKNTNGFHPSVKALMGNFKAYSTSKIPGMYNSGVCEVFQLPLSDLLLYINADHPWVREIAAWRFDHDR